MQKLAREYLDELNKRHKKNRRALVAWILMAVLVVGGVMGTLAQYGVAFEGSPECGKEEHTHDDGCYTETRELTCDLAEGEEHTHDDVCYTVSKELACELEEHSHGEDCFEKLEDEEEAEPEKTDPVDGNKEPDGTETQPVVKDDSEEIIDSTESAAPVETMEPLTENEAETETETETEIETEMETEAESETQPEETVLPSFEAIEKIDGGKVKIRATAGEGVLPEDAQLKVEPIVKRDLEELESQNGVTAEEIEKAREINEKYDEVYQALEKSVPENEVKKIAGFTAYDISFLAADEYGEMTEFKPQGEVGVEMSFTQAFFPESVADNEGIEITDVNLVHMREISKGLQAETMENADIDLSKDSEVENVAFTSSDFSIYSVTWTRGPLKLEYEDGDVTISVEESEIGNIPEGAVLNVVPVVEENEETEEQYRNIETKLEGKAEEDSYKIAGFMAYDLSLTDQDDAAVELGGDVKVSIEYKKAVVPNAIVPELTDVSMMMLNLDEEAETKQQEKTEKPKIQAKSRMATPVVASASESEVVDLSAEKKVTTLNVTENKEIQKAEVVMGSLEPVMMAVWRVSPVQVDVGMTKIVDKIDQNGRLEAEVDEGAQQQIAQAIELAKQEAESKGEEFKRESVIRYEWYKSINNGEYKKVERKKIGDEYTVAEDGSWVNVVLDDGALNNEHESVKYKFELYLYNEKVTVNFHRVDYANVYPNINPDYNSDFYPVLYWNELRNGSFENPITTDNYKQYEQYETKGLVWKTTGRDESIEIVNVRYVIDGHYNWYGEYRNPPDGVQFAELNCEASGALYQDVITIPGEKLNYWFSHRARGNAKNATQEFDTMYVVIVPAWLARTGGDNGGAIDTQEEVLKLMENQNNYNGAVYVKEYRDDDQAWHDYEEIGIYEPTSYLTRFFFVAGETASGLTQEGNFLDRVGFSQKLPPANPGTFDLRITKKVEGLTLEGLDLNGDLNETEVSNKIAAAINKKLPNLKFEISAKDKEGKDVPDAPCVNKNGVPITDPDWTWTVDGNGSYVGSYKVSGEIGDLKELTYTVKESGAEISSYTLQDELEISGGTVIRDSDGKDVSAALKEGEAAAFRFTNTYTQDLKAKFQIEKIIEGLYGEQLSQLQKNLYFDVELVDDGLLDASVKYENVKLTFDSSGKGVCTIENVLPGRTYKITEKNAAVPGYALNVTVADDLQKDQEGNAWINVTVPTLEEISQNPESAIIIAQFKNVYQQDKVTIDLKKYGSDYNTDPLPGATFSLYAGELNTDTNEVTWTETPLESYEDFSVADTGEPELKLASGYYKLVETKAPGSYQLLNEDIYFKVGQNNVTLTDKSGNSLTSDSQKMWKLEALASGTVTAYTLSVLNEALYELPSTGGSGIYRYMISGVLLMLAGVLILYNNKRARRCAGV